MRYDVVRMNGTNRARTRRTRFKVTLQSVTLKTWNIFLRLTNNRNPFPMESVLGYVTLCSIVILTL